MKDYMNLIIKQDIETLIAGMVMAFAVGIMFGLIASVFFFL